MKEASLLYCLPDNPFFGITQPSAAKDGVAGESELGVHGTGHAVQEATYACALITVRFLADAGVV